MAIRQYFREGVLPQKGTVCEIEDHMFLNRINPPVKELDAESAKVLDALRALGGQLQVGRPFYYGVL